MLASTISMNAHFGLISKQNSYGRRTLAGLFLLLCAALFYVGTLDNGLMIRELEGGDLITHQYAQVQALVPRHSLTFAQGWHLQPESNSNFGQL